MTLLLWLCHDYFLFFFLSPFPLCSSLLFYFTFHSMWVFRFKSKRGHQGKKRDGWEMSRHEMLSNEWERSSMKGQLNVSPCLWVKQWNEFVTVSTSILLRAPTPQADSHLLAQWEWAAHVPLLRGIAPGSKQLSASLFSELLWNIIGFVVLS